VSLTAAITAARADGAGMGAAIELDVRGIAGQVEHELGRALTQQTWAVTLNAFPPSIKLPMAAPLLAIEHVKFYDQAGELQTLDPQDYIAPKGSVPAQVMPAPGRRWPDTALRADAVEVQYRCGYGADHTAVPAAIQSYILGRLELKHLPAGSRVGEHLSGLLDSFRIYG
jgi:uncharacterized phiE125 gp8 family phage protein